MKITKIDIETSRVDGTQALYDVTVNVELNHAADSDDDEGSGRSGCAAI